ncbi:hypothetical protein GGS21DRAFT_417952 [Xylaria nigripes]|nr:hypothetical protein GGS21DRAFT_417952 [Xylaria nigripes]
MAEEPSLPSLPKASWDSHYQTSTDTRKRTHNADSPPALSSNSSDPAIFSSDDDPHVDNYVNGRHRKKRYVGSWFQQRPASSDSTISEAVVPQPRPNRTFERQQDSGVWMGSDGLVEPDEEFDIEMEDSPESRLSELRGYNSTPSSISTPEEAIIYTKIDLAIEEGEPMIDLSSLGISKIPNGILSQLRELVIIPSVDKDVPFERANPQLGIYLSNNNLTRVPGDLLNLEHLTYLSLRNNRLEELPPSIGKLRNLQELNVSLNCLQYLPGELLSLLQFPSALSSLHIHPNLFYQPKGGLPPYPIIDTEIRNGDRQKVDLGITDDGVTKMYVSPDGRPVDEIRRQVLETWPKCTWWQVTLVARSPVQYSDSQGFIFSEFCIPYELPRHPSNIKSGVRYLHFIPTEDVSRLSVPEFPGRLSRDPSRPSHVPSLFEMALKSACRAAQTWDLASHLPREAPLSLLRSIKRIATQSAENGNSGTLPCSICGRQVVTPVTQWIEWWDISYWSHSPGGITVDLISRHAEENVIPFLKRGCSQSCVPKPMTVGQPAPGSLQMRSENR